MRFSPLFLLASVWPLALPAVQTGVIVDEGYADFFKGELTNVSLSRAGEIGPAPNLTEVVRLSEPSVWKVIPDGEDGFVVGTGISGKVLRVTKEGEVSELFSPDAALVRGLARDAEGNLFVATSPNGAVFRLPAEGGKPELFFDPDAIYIWDLVIADDALWITTGMPAKFLRLPLDGETEQAETWFAARDDHLTALVRRGESWLVGSSPRGIVYEVESAETTRAIFKANEKEIRSLAVGADGSILVTTFSDSVGAPSSDSGELPPMVVSASSPGSNRSRPGGGSLEAGKGEGYLVRIDPQGIARGEWRSTEGGVFSLAPVGDQLWLLGFSQDGKLFGFSDRNSWELLQQMPRGGEVSAIVADPADPSAYYLFTSNPGVVYRLGGQSEEDCTFVSRVLDARQMGRWGRFEATLATPGEVTIESRSGLTDEPDSTWSEWAALADGRIASPQSRFLQYRLRFPPSSAARFLRARLFHTMPNSAPIISQIKVLGFGADIRVAQINAPMIDFTAAFKDAQMERFDDGGTERMKLERRADQTLRTLIWRAGDPNGDELTFDVFLKRAAEVEWTVLARELSDPHFLFNAAGLAPDAYQFKVVAHDGLSNAPEVAQSSELVSELVLIDATPPVLTSLEAIDGGRTLVVEAQGDVSRLVAAQVAIDGGEPISLRPVDGIYDSPVEQFRYSFTELPAKPVSVLFEVLDESGNQAALSLRSPTR